MNSKHTHNKNSPSVEEASVGRQSRSHSLSATPQPSQPLCLFFAYNAKVFLLFGEKYFEYKLFRIWKSLTNNKTFCLSSSKQKEGLFRFVLGNEVFLRRGSRARAKANIQVMS